MGRVVVDDVNRDADDGFVEGCWGTVSEQLDESHYDGRLDANEGLLNGRLEFPTEKLYGREGDLELVRCLYGELIEERDRKNSSAGGDVACGTNSRVLWVGGYTGVGKSSLVAKSTAKLIDEHGDDTFCVMGKFSKLQSARPFSAISDALDQLTAEITKPERGELLQKIRKELYLYDGDVNSRLTLASTFPSTAPLFFPEEAASERAPVIGNLNEVKEAFKYYMNCVCICLPNPLIFFLDDGQWMDEASFELLNNTLPSSVIRNILFIGAYRSYEVEEGHSFQNLMDNVDKSFTNERKIASRTELFGLSPDDVGEFISDTLGKSGAAEVSGLTELVYATTLGVILYVKQAMEELIQKKAVYYDVILFTWEYKVTKNVTKANMRNYLSDDVIDMVKSKIAGLPREIRMVVVIMSFMPYRASLPTMMALLEGEGIEEAKAETLLGYAVKKGILSKQLDADRYMYAFAHDKIKEASHGMIPEGRSRHEFSVRMSNVLVDLGKDDFLHKRDSPHYVQCESDIEIDDGHDDCEFRDRTHCYFCLFSPVFVFIEHVMSMLVATKTSAALEKTRGT